MLVIDQDTDTQLIHAAMPHLPVMITLKNGNPAETEALFAALLRAAELQAAG